MQWVPDWFICKADSADVAFQKEQARKNRQSRPSIKIGDELWRVAHAIGPIGINHSHWAGWHLELNKEQVEFVAAACAAYEAAGNAWPKDRDGRS